MTPASANVPFAAPTALAADEPLDWVFIEGFQGLTRIGIHESELHGTQPVVIDVAAGTPRARACDTDRIADTLDYAALRLRLQRLLLEHGVQLLEALAEQVAQIVLTEFGAHWVRVRVIKPRKFEDVEAVGVQIERRREPRRSGRSSSLTLIGAGLVPGSRLPEE
jgi:dihydroneopterin aldolase